ncbi:MAG: GNAT family N-acetyltransferase [Dysgonomonas sp.]
MIQFANEHTAPLVRQMWKTCFEDTDEFLDIYFHYKYRNENTLIYFDGNKAVASLQMLPYSITFYKETIPFAYLAGLCTLPEYRNKGYMAKLINEAHHIIAQRNIHLSILIPAEDWLYGFYEKYGYEQVFERDDRLIPLKEIIDQYSGIGEAYKAFNSLFCDKDFCVQKNEKDFEAIVEEYKSDGFPPKTNLSGMACIIDVYEGLRLYAKDNLSKQFRLKVNDSRTGASSIYYINKGNVELVQDLSFDIETNTHLLCRLLFGYRLSELDSKLSIFFEEHQPIMNLMLE